MTVDKSSDNAPRELQAEGVEAPVRAATPQVTPDTPPAPEAKSDPLFVTLQYLARRWGRPISRDVLVAGLPLEDGKLTMALLPRALERIGLLAREQQAVLRDLADFDMPALVASEAGQLLVIIGRTGPDALKCFNPHTGKEQVIQTDDGEWRNRHKLMIIKPAPGGRAQAFDGIDRGAVKQRHWLRAALAGHEKSLTMVMLAATFINVFAVAMPLFTLNVYDRVLPNKAVSTLWVLAIGLLTVFVFDFLLKVARGAIIDYAGRRIDFRLSATLFDRVINSTVSARPSSTGAFVNRIVQYEVLRDFFTSHTVVMFIDILFMGVFVYVIASLIGWVVIFPVLGALIAIVATILIGMRSGAAVKSALQESSSRNAILVEALSATQTVKATRSEGQFQRKWEATILASSDTQSKIKWYQSLAGQITGIVSQISTVGIIIGGTYSFSEGNITMGAIIASMMLSSRIIAPIGQISAALLRTRSAIEAYQSLDEIMQLPDERTVRSNFVTREISAGNIDFQKVRFAYPGIEHYVLDQISFSIKAGEKVGIIGRIGSGKTTLGRLMVNFYEASEGEILIDGVAIKQYHPAELRRQVGLVLQDPELFNGTVKENILLSDPEADDARLLEIARRTGVEEFVSRHPLGFDMPVGERGVLLSGGQRQAIALARTMLTNPKILFLDEPSSSMDMATERQLIGNLSRSLAPEHTVLIATHRFSLLNLVNRLIVLDNGRIAADGPRDAVLAQLRAAGGGDAQ
ncbi:type I secretion system permease/ATPase [Mariluticola halotolerans]|uniref:type I secretion system permease/ATPase n=1 Tax=Mariluticola halotolerans TaxID=2909283 RepID=UPI0026E1F1B1|nr:type I secretion system permease/ATPase [Mariluticola halotolerans]UJQ95778.1 type I secretion system permease/ATPase [Mariluticola halotolerans]